MAQWVSFFAWEQTPESIDRSRARPMGARCDRQPGFFHRQNASRISASDQLSALAAPHSLILLFVFFCATVGVLLVILPWRPEWTDNYFLLGSPRLRAFVSNGFVRGLCSGLGLLDIWIGFWEAVHFHDEKQH